MAAILQVGKTAIRDALKGISTHLAVSSDQTAFNASQTEANPNSDPILIKSATNVDVDGNTFDSTIQIDGDSEFTNQLIYTIASLFGSSRTQAISRTVRAQPIGVQAGDLFTVGVRAKVEDNSP